MKGNSENLLMALMKTYTCGEFELLEDMQEEHSKPLICRHENGKIIVRTQEYNDKAYDRW